MEKNKTEAYKLISSISFENYLVIFALIIFAILLVGYGVPFLKSKLRKKSKRRKAGLYQAKKILTANETEFYNRLISALPEYTVLTQVAMSALIEPRVDRTTNGSEYMRRRAKFSQKYIDFVVCRPGKLL